MHNTRFDADISHKAPWVGLFLALALVDLSHAAVLLKPFNDRTDAVAQETYRAYAGSFGLDRARSGLSQLSNMHALLERKGMHGRASGPFFYPHHRWQFTGERLAREA
jgi:hypothetical protein